MITLKTKRKIKYDLQIESYHNGTKETEFILNATCLDWIKEFSIKVPNYGVPFASVGPDMVMLFDLSDIEKWADKVAVAEISKQAAEICLDRDFGQMHIGFKDGLFIDMFDYTNNESHSATGYNEIIKLLKNLKNG